MAQSKHAEDGDRRAHAHDDHDDHAHVGSGGGHGHGGPVVWNPDAERSNKAKLLMALGVLLVVCGGALYWWGQPPRFAVPSSQALETLDAAGRSELERRLKDVVSKPSDVARIAELAKFYESRQMWREAEACFGRADELRPSEPEFAVAAARASAQLDPALGLARIRAVLVRFPNHEPALALARELEARRASE